MAFISEQDYQEVTTLLGRPPRGLADIVVRCTDGKPVVIQVASLVEGKPFPTLYWLVDRQLSYAIDQLEAAGLITEFQQQIDQSPELQQAMAADHHWYIAHRQSLMEDNIRQALVHCNFHEVLASRGIGGIENFSRIRCLHTYYAAHLVRANTVGTLLDGYWRDRGIRFPHLASA